MEQYAAADFEFFQRIRHSQGDKMPVPHRHRHHELYFLASGQASYFVDDHICMLNPGEMIFVPKGAFHQTIYSHTDCSERLLLVFDSDFLGSEYLPYLSPLTENPHIVLPKKSLPAFETIFRNIEYECTRKKAGYTEMNRLYLRQLLVLISRCRIEDSAPPLFGTYRIIQDAITHIGENYSQQISVEALAEMCSLSVGYFSKQFRRITGMTPSAYITATRITAAKALLKTSQKSITEVAMACGFNDSSYFSMMFRRFEGMTPKKYAAKYK